jgi:hypothetical protein
VDRDILTTFPDSPDPLFLREQLRHSTLNWWLSKAVALGAPLCGSIILGIGSTNIAINACVFVLLVFADTFAQSSGPPPHSDVTGTSKPERAILRFVLESRKENKDEATYQSPLIVCESELYEIIFERAPGEQHS